MSRAQNRHPNRSVPGCRNSLNPPPKGILRPAPTGILKPQTSFACARKSKISPQTVIRVTLPAAIQSHPRRSDAPARLSLPRRTRIFPQVGEKLGIGGLETRLFSIPGLRREFPAPELANLRRSAKGLNAAAAPDWNRKFSDASVHNRSLPAEYLQIQTQERTKQVRIVPAPHPSPLIYKSPKNVESSPRRTPRKCKALTSRRHFAVN